VPKIKTSRAAVKRFKKTASGKIKRRKAYGSHLLSKKSSKRKRSLRTPTLIHSKDMQRIRRMLPYY